ncbi:hypothetical protein BS50DRAFT_416398 [Corynespora cassiicola Philippines]|uniref:Secreted protein n=1 Tax=Corynespora cassiicola Philippines TaxID=1448308 RepID=A0A2T2NMB0_CORCC|nr:hypothetical protein BS50DRAFT_416398 [Corynespora cassiicola Philippines]
MPSMALLLFPFLIRLLQRHSLHPAVRSEALPGLRGAHISFESGSELRHTAPLTHPRACTCWLLLLARMAWRAKGTVRTLREPVLRRHLRPGSTASSLAEQGREQKARHTAPGKTWGRRVSRQVGKQASKQVDGRFFFFACLAAR